MKTILFLLVCFFSQLTLAQTLVEKATLPKPVQRFVSRQLVVDIRDMSLDQKAELFNTLVGEEITLAHVQLRSTEEKFTATIFPRGHVTGVEHGNVLVRATGLVGLTDRSTALGGHEATVVSSNLISFGVNKGQDRRITLDGVDYIFIPPTLASVCNFRLN